MTLFMKVNPYTTAVLDKIEEVVRKNHGRMTSDVHRVYLSAACYYAAVGIKRHGGTLKRADRFDATAKAYCGTVAPGFLRWLVEVAEHTPPAFLDRTMMGKTTLNGEPS